MHPVLRGPPQDISWSDAMMHARNNAVRVQDADKDLRLFMMMDSLRTGGSERQFALMAGAFRRGPFDLYLGCLQRCGKFLEDLGDIEEYPLGGSFLTLRALGSLRRLLGFLRRTRSRSAHNRSIFTLI